MTENKLLTHTDQKKVLNIEDSDKAAEAIRTLTNLGIIQWRDATEEEDSLGIDVIADVTFVAHDGYMLSPYLYANTASSDVSHNTQTIFLSVSKGMVRYAWGAPTKKQDEQLNGNDLPVGDRQRQIGVQTE